MRSEIDWIPPCRKTLLSHRLHKSTAGIPGIHRAPYCESAPQPPLMKRTNDTARAPPPDRKMISDGVMIVNQKEKGGVGADIIRPRRMHPNKCCTSANPHHIHCRAATRGPPHPQARQRRGTGPRPTLDPGWRFVGADALGGPAVRIMMITIHRRIRNRFPSAVGRAACARRLPAAESHRRAFRNPPYVV